MKPIRARENRNAEGYCRTCGGSLGISGQCSICAMGDLPDVKNIEPCPVCDGAGYVYTKEPDWIFDEDNTAVCWGCEGTGLSD